jgi:hypothetical protein
MTWARRIFLTIPFAVVSVLTILVSLADRPHSRLERIPGYGFLFATQVAPPLSQRFWRRFSLESQVFFSGEVQENLSFKTRRLTTRV